MKPNSLTHCLQDLPQLKEDPQNQFQQQTILKAQNLTLGMLPTTKPTTPQFYIIELKSPFKINKLITMAYNTFVDPLLYQLITAKTIGACMLPTNFQSLGQIDMAALEVKKNRLYYRGHLFILNSENLQQQLIQMAHNFQSSGHPGRREIYKFF